ncbi:MAG: zinc ribbon domain-containing protein [Chloroflexi bacterium]|nr:zinc ribbon domain-containing protein [Chloroflexota bacterium]
MPYCANCGNEVNREDKFCFRCGAQLMKESEQKESAKAETMKEELRKTGVQEGQPQTSQTVTEHEYATMNRRDWITLAIAVLMIALVVWTVHVFGG